MKTDKTEKRIRRRGRIRAKITGTRELPRLSVFRSNRHLYAQLIDDTQGRTLAQSGSLSGNGKNKKSKGVDEAKKIGLGLGEQILKRGFKKIVFDRGGYKYHGQVKALADGLRDAGIKF